MHCSAVHTPEQPHCAEARAFRARSMPHPRDTLHSCSARYCGSSELIMPALIGRSAPASTLRRLSCTAARRVALLVSNVFTVLPMFTFRNVAVLQSLFYIRCVNGVAFRRCTQLAEYETGSRKAGDAFL
eukprot:IDg6145t1